MGYFIGKRTVNKITTKNSQNLQENISETVTNENDK